MGEFNSNYHHVHYCGQKSLRRNGLALRVSRRIQNAVLGAISKQTEWSQFISKANHSTSIIQVYASTTDSEKSLSWSFLWRPTRSSRTNTTKRCHLHHRGFEYKNRKSRVTRNNRQVWPWSTKWIRTKTNRVLPREHSDHSKHAFPITQEMSLHIDVTRWSILKWDWLYSFQPKMEKLYIVSEKKSWRWLWLRSPAPYCKIQAYVEESRENQ